MKSVILRDETPDFVLLFNESKQKTLDGWTRYHTSIIASSLSPWSHCCAHTNTHYKTSVWWLWRENSEKRVLRKRSSFNRSRRARVASSSYFVFQETRTFRDLAPSRSSSLQKRHTSPNKPKSTFFSHFTLGLFSTIAQHVDHDGDLDVCSFDRICTIARLQCLCQPKEWRSRHDEPLCSQAIHVSGSCSTTS